MINSVFICLTCVLLQGTTCRILFTSSKPHKRSNLIESRQTTLNPISNTDTESEESGNKSKNENSELEVFHNKLTTHVLLQSDSNDILSPDSSGEKSNEFDKTKTTLRPKSVSPNIGKLTNIKKTKGSRELVEINLFSSELNSETEDADDMFWSRPLSNKNLNKDSEEYFKKTSKKPGTPFPLRQGITSDSGVLLEGATSKHFRDKSEYDLFLKGNTNIESDDSKSASDDSVVDDQVSIDDEAKNPLVLESDANDATVAEPSNEVLGKESSSQTASHEDDDNTKKKEKKHQKNKIKKTSNIHKPRLANKNKIETDKHNYVTSNEDQSLEIKLENKAMKHDDKETDTEVLNDTMNEVKIIKKHKKKQKKQKRTTTDGVSKSETHAIKLHTKKPKKSTDIQPKSKNPSNKLRQKKHKKQTRIVIYSEPKSGTAINKVHHKKHKKQKQTSVEDISKPEIRSKKLHRKKQKKQKKSTKDDTQTPEDDYVGEMQKADKATELDP